MKTFASLVIGLSLALAGAVMAQAPTETPSKKGKNEQKTTETKPTRGAPNETKATRKEANAEKTPTETGAKPRGGKAERGAKGENANATGAETSPAGMNAGAETGKKGKQGRNATTNTAAETGASASPGASAGMETGKKGKKGRAETATKGTTPAPSAAASMSPAAARTSPIASPGTSASPATSATAATAATSATGANATMTKEQGTVGKGGKKVETQQVQQIKQQHVSFKAQPKPAVAPAVTFNQNYRIVGAESWQGPQYEVFRSYHPEWHDRAFYTSRYQRVELIGGGYYYFNNGYWYPAWGYDQSVAYYPYDGPIYVGHQTRPPDQVIADVQSELQQMGYYTGEVDGLLGPLTRQALRDYQQDHGLMVTEAIDEPTLDALQLS